jgi:hypothetical protein
MQYNANIYIQHKKLTDYACALHTYCNTCYTCNIRTGILVAAVDCVAARQDVQLALSEGYGVLVARKL